MNQMNLETNPTPTLVLPENKTNTDTARNSRPEGTYCEPTVLFTEETSKEINWKAYYDF